MRVADYIADTLVKRGIRHVFSVTGGASMHLNDALGNHPDLEVIYCHHEQACAMAAESYARLSGRIAAVCVTAGPGATNAITGVFGAYTDSVPMLVLSGQVKRATLKQPGIRQLGDQEIDIVQMVKGITKFARTILDPEDIADDLSRALEQATQRRPGPAWLDIPIDIQAAEIEIDPCSLTNWQELYPIASGPLREMYARLSKAKRPVILAGGGIRASGSHDLFLQFIDKLQIPVTTGWNAHDVIWNDHPLYVGRPGTVGDRAGNFAVQSSDFLLVLGSRLNIRQISYNWEAFAPNAYKVMVDVDPGELQKPTLKIDLPIHADLKDFFPLALDMGYKPRPKHQEYLGWCKERQRKYPVVLPEYRNTEKGINPYYFMECLFKHLREDDVVVCADGTACVTAFQAAYLKRGQRLYTNSGCAAMGYELPAAIGACFARNRKRVICIAGDGSIQMNIQELATIAHHNLPIKIFVLNNGGYHSIRQTQQNFFPGRIVGCGSESGLNVSRVLEVAEGYGFCTNWMDKNVPGNLDDILRDSIPELCEVSLDRSQSFSPKLMSYRDPSGAMVTPPLDDMSPLLSREELAGNRLG